MTAPSQSDGSQPDRGDFHLDRRRLLAYSTAFGASFLAANGIRAQDNQSDAATSAAAPPAGRRYEMLKSINLWAFPYPDRMSLTDCLQLAKDAGFDAVELNYNLEGDISVESSEADLERIGRQARDIGIEISGLCSFLFWPYPLTSHDEARRRKGRELSLRMIDAAHQLGTENLLVVPGAVYIPWEPEPEPVANDVCWRRATEAIRAAVPRAEQAGVYLNLENIFANGFLLSPQEMNAFVDQFESDHVKIHFDTGNIMQYQFPEHWIKICGSRIKNVHLKEYDKREGTQFSLFSFRPLLAGSTDWPAVLEAFDQIDYRGYLTFEYFHPYNHFPEALVHHTSDALDRMLGKA